MHDQPIIVKKKKVHGHGHHGGSWKVAYADFVTAMMAFFMVLWILGMSEEDRSIIASYFNDPISFAKGQPPQKPSIIPMPGNPQTFNRSKSNSGGDPKQEEEEKMREVGGQLQAALKADPKVKDLIEHV